MRLALAAVPQQWRFALFRRLVDCEAAPDARLQLKIADSQDELQACFSLLHDAYVSAGFMKRDPSGLRVTIYHALPTTTTLCAKFDGEVVGTVTLIRDGVFGFPMQSVFDLSAVRAAGGQIAEISALAVAPRFRKTGGKILFPLMKFMYDYATQYFDTRHLVIAVNPNRIEMYESLLFFRRLTGSHVDNYDFANGAPAVGATLDLMQAPDIFRTVYGQRPPRRNLHHYFIESRLPNIQWPARRFHTTCDPVMTPALLEHFFNHQTQVFESLDDRKRRLLQSIYGQTAYAEVLPAPRQSSAAALRSSPRFSIRCPATLEVLSYDDSLRYALTVVDVSLNGLQAECGLPLPEGTCGRLDISLGTDEQSTLQVVAVRRAVSDGRTFYGFRVLHADSPWLRAVTALSESRTQADLTRLGGSASDSAATASRLASDAQEQPADCTPATSPSAQCAA